MKEFDIEEISKQFDFSSNSLKDNGNGVLLTVHEIEVLKANDIDYKNCNSLKEILCLIEDVFQNSYESERERRWHQRVSPPFYIMLSPSTYCDMKR